MLNKIYRQYELNKKYAIRKFSVGVFSVAVGLLVSNANQLPVINTYLGNNIVQASETSVIYSNPNANGEIDEKGTNNNAISKIELISETDKKIRLRISIVDDVDVSKGFVLKEFKTLYGGHNEPLSFNNEEIGNIPYVSETVKKVKKPNEFSNINEYYSYIQSLDSQSDEFNQELKLQFNEKFKKYDKNRVIEFDLEVIRDTNVIDYLHKKNETSNEKTKMLEDYYKNVKGNIYINNNKIYSMKNLTGLNLSLNNIDNNPKEKEYNETDTINNYSSGVVDVENKPTYLSKLYVNNPERFTRNENNSTYINSANKKVIKAGTKFRITLNSNLVDFKNNPKNIVKSKLTYKETTPNIFKIKEIFKGEQLVEIKEIEKSLSSYYNTPISYKKINNNTYELEVLEDVIIKANSLREEGISLPSNLYETELKEDFLNHIDVLAYKKALETREFGNLFGTITTEIKEPDDTDYIKKEVSPIHAKLATSYVFGESSTGTIKVKYVDENNNELAPLETIVENKPWYNKVEIPKKEIKGYEFVSSDQPLNDLVMSGERVVTLTYRSSEKTKEVPFETVYKADENIEKGVEEIETNGENGIVGYKENDPEYSRVIKPKVDKIIKVGTKPKIEVTSIASPKKYIKDETREKGQPDIVIQGKSGTTTITTTYSVKENDGSITENKGNPVIVNPTDTIIKIAAKNKVEIIKNNDKTIERTTSYTVNEKTGEISETVTDKLISSNTPIDENNNPILPPIVDDLPEYNGGVNPIDSLVNEKPEYKGPLSTNTPVDDKGELVLPPTVNDLPEYNGGVNPIDSLVNEKPEYKGPLSTNTPVDDKGELVLPPTVNDLPEYNGGANPVDTPIHEIPEYTGPLSTNTPVDDKGELILPPVVDDLPEYKGGVNPVDSPIHEIPEYTGPLSTNTPVDDKGELILPPVVDDLPEYNTQTLNNEKSEKTKEESKQERELPNTNSTSILTTLVSSLIGTLGLGYKSKKRK